MASVSEQILDALDDLDTEKLKRFKWHLKNHKGFSAADLEKADAPDTVDLMMKRFGPEEAVKITVDILRKMNHNHLAEELENKHKQDQVEGSIEDPALAGAELKSTGVTFTNIVPRTRNDFLQCKSVRKQAEKLTECVHVLPVEDSHQLTLDPNTAHKGLHLSDGNRGFTVPDTLQSYPDHPDRFDLCISYVFWHNKIRTVLPLESSCRRIGVFVDHSAGTLSFYIIYSDTMSLIHTVQTTFTQTLYPGFGSNFIRSSVKLEELSPKAMAGRRPMELVDRQVTVEVESRLRRLEVEVRDSPATVTMEDGRPMELTPRSGLVKVQAMGSWTGPVETQKMKEGWTGPAGTNERGEGASQPQDPFPSQLNLPSSPQDSDFPFVAVACLEFELRQVRTLGTARAGGCGEADSGAVGEADRAESGETLCNPPGSRAPWMRSSQVCFTPAPGHHGPWVQQQRKTRARPRPRTWPPPPPPVFEIFTRNRFAPLRETECSAVIVRDSIVRYFRATLAKGKVHTHCFSGAHVLDVSAQIPAILKGGESVGSIILHAGVNDIKLRQTEVLKRDFSSLIETVRSTSPATRIIVSGPLPTYRRGHERLFHADGLHPSRVGAELLSDNISSKYILK
ncbi:Zinc-binding protein A33 [Labeo rohita]|uniref:Zinc-binding protein A33 n=1 Tax=Labeo rohita TaxID=84645 RepID=A0ABQ8MSK2_LABRO|nr:Zinc-binding protein A33 [Labeo rohita]